MENIKFEGKAIGLIFDLSIRHAKNGKRIVDVVKNKMNEIVRSLLVDGEDSLYLYHPEATDCAKKHGEQVFAIGNYNTDGFKINLNFALRQTLYVLMAEDLTFLKYVFLITDKIDNIAPIEKILQLNKKENVNCKFFLIGVGDYYDKNVLRKSKELSNDITYIHLNDPAELDINLFKEKKDGKDTHGKTNEQRECVQLSSGHHCSVPRTIRHADAIDAESVSFNEEQLLPTDFGGRLLSES